MFILNDDDFLKCIQDLLDHPLVQQLDEYNQHFNVSRLDHCKNVAFLTYKKCKYLGLNQERTESATRAALLHDLFLYDWRTEQPTEGNHALVHPKASLENAKKVMELTPIQENIILSHMFPLGPMPKSTEAWVVQWADKQSASLEYAIQYKRTVQKTRLYQKLISFASIFN